MKLGTETASLSNHLMARATIGQPKPVVGMGATILGWTDRYAGTIVEVYETSTSKRWKYQIVVQLDNAQRTDSNGLSESQDYQYSPNPNGAKYVFNCERNGGAWIEMRDVNVDTPNYRRLVVPVGSRKGLRIGERDQYRDPSF